MWIWPSPSLRAVALAVLPSGPPAVSPLPPSAVGAELPNRTRAAQAPSETEPITVESIDRLLPADPPSTDDEPSAPASVVLKAGPSDQAAQAWEASHHFRVYLGGLLFTLFGASLFSLGRLREKQVPQEAIIGIIYAVSSAVTLALLYKAPQDVAEQTQTMLVGRILFVDAGVVLKTTVLYAVVGLVHFVWRRPFLMISFQPQQAESQGLAVRWWDFLFYITFGIVVTSSVQMAGVLLVFSYLIVPAVCAMLFLTDVLPRLCFGWAVGILGSLLGIGLSVWLDMPTGASIVIAFGGIVALLMVVRLVLGKRG